MCTRLMVTPIIYPPPPVGGGEGGHEVKLVEVSLERLLGRTKGGVGAA